MPLLFFVLLFLPVQSDVADPHTELLSRIRQHMAEILSNQPNYTCRETIERTVRQPDSKHFSLIDRLRLEVAYVGGRELYAWPGATNFEDRPIEEMVGAGAAIGAGNFATHARAVFASNAPRFSWGGEEQRDGVRVVRFNFRVPKERSHYAIQTGPQPFIVGYEGFLEANAATLDTIRLQLDAVNLPDELKLRSTEESMQYAQQRIGESSFLLPVHSQLSLTEMNGRENRNRNRLDRCRQYTGESTVRFDVDESALAGRGPAPPIVLPGNLGIQATLRDYIDGDESAVGDPVYATVSSDVKKGGHVVVPKGAALTGRITNLEVQTLRSLVYVGAGLRFDTIEFGGARGVISADIDSAGVGKTYRIGRMDKRGGRMVYVETKTGRVAAGTRLELRTN